MFITFFSPYLRIVSIDAMSQSEELCGLHYEIAVKSSGDPIRYAVIFGRVTVSLSFYFLMSVLSESLRV